MTEKRKDQGDNAEWPGDEIPGKLQDEMHHGAEAAIDMNEYAKSDAERVATPLASASNVGSAAARSVGSSRRFSRCRSSADSGWASDHAAALASFSTVTCRPVACASRRPSSP